MNCRVYSGISGKISVVVSCSFKGDWVRISVESSVMVNTEKTGTEIVIIMIVINVKRIILLKSSFEKLTLGYFNSFPHAWQKFWLCSLFGLQFGQDSVFVFVVKIWIFQIFSDSKYSIVVPIRIRIGPPKRWKRSQAVFTPNQ